MRSIKSLSSVLAALCVVALLAVASAAADSPVGTSCTDHPYTAEYDVGLGILQNGDNNAIKITLDGTNPLPVSGSQSVRVDPYDFHEELCRVDIQFSDGTTKYGPNSDAVTTTASGLTTIKRVLVTAEKTTGATLGSNCANMEMVVYDTDVSSQPTFDPTGPTGASAYVSAVLTHSPQDSATVAPIQTGWMLCGGGGKDSDNSFWGNGVPAHPFEAVDPSWTQSVSHTAAAGQTIHDFVFGVARIPVPRDLSQPTGSTGSTGSAGSNGTTGSGDCTAISSCPPPPAKQCIVPRLKGKTPYQAKQALMRAGFKLGKVTRGHKPQRRHIKQVVRTQSAKAGTQVPCGTKVPVKTAWKSSK